MFAAVMNYQGVLDRRDLVLGLCALWFLVTYYPLLSIGLIGALVITTFWERTVRGGRVIVSMFRAHSKAKGFRGQNITLTQTTLEDEEEQKTARSMKQVV